MVRDMTAPQTFRRIVFYVPGFDPFPARRYRELYRREAAAQAAVSGHDITVSRGADAASWQVAARIEGARVETRVEVLGWSDIVQQNMGQGIGSTYLQMLQVAWIYLSSGALFRLARLRRGPLLAALYPVGMLLGQAVIAGLAGWAGFALASQLLPWGAAALVALAVVWAMLRGARALDGRLYVYYLMHDYAYTARWQGAYGPELSARIDGFADRIARALTEPVDEVLVVGHSSGAHLAVSALARVRASDGPALALLTLGQVVPMVTALPRAQALRADLAQVSRRADIAWVDVTAPGDGCCFALCDPVAVSGLAGPDQRGPLVFSARFSETLSAERLRALRWRFFRLHFQYLCAFDRVAGYDYFAITAGPRRLRDRYADRRSSVSCITAPVLAQAA